jgi:hypothetical protein
MKIAAVIDNLGPSQKSFYLIKEFNKACSNINLCLSSFFVRSAIPVVPVMFSCKSISFLSGFDGAAISTTIKETDTLLKSSNNARKIFYMWDAEWLISPRNFDEISSVLLDNRLDIVCRSDSHAKLLENFCNKPPVGIVDNWNIDQILGILNV